MPEIPNRIPRRRGNEIVGILFLAVALAAGLLLGTESTLTLRRDARGSVTAVNAWRYAGRVTLIAHSVTGLREVRFEKPNLNASERRSSSSGSLFGPSSPRDQMVLVGDGRFAYPYQDDQGLIRGFLDNPRNAELVLSHPVNIRRTVASWVLLGFAALGVAGWICKLALGRDPLAGAEHSVKPLPPAIGQTIFVSGVLLLLWFFLAGHHVFGPLATRKVKLLMTSATHDDPAGIARAVREGVFVDCRDGQGMTALMLAVRAGAAGAVEALLQAGANPNLRTSSDETPLLMAIHTGRAGLAARSLTLILKAGADVKQPDNYGWTPLFFAAAGGHGEAVRTLLAAGADARRTLPDGRTVADLGRSYPEVSEALQKAAP